MKNSYHSTTVPAIEAVTTLRRSVLLLASSALRLVTAPMVSVQSWVMWSGLWKRSEAGRGAGVRAASVLRRRLERAVDLGDQDAAVLVGQPGVHERGHGLVRLGDERQRRAGRLTGVDRQPQVLVQQRHGEPALEVPVHRGPLYDARCRVPGPQHPGVPG